MAEPSLILQVDQIADVLRGFVRLKASFMGGLPRDLARLKERLGKVLPEGGQRRSADIDLFYRIGVVLARQREPLTMR